MLICNAGLSHPDLFTNTSVDAFKAEMVCTNALMFEHRT